LSTIPAFVARAGHGKVSTIAGAKPPSGGQEQFTQALGQKPRQAGNAFAGSRPQPTSAGPAGEQGQRAAKLPAQDEVQPDARHQAAATNGKTGDMAVAQLAALLDPPVERHKEMTGHDDAPGKPDMFPADATGRQADATADPADRSFSRSPLNTLAVLAGMATSGLPGTEATDPAPEQEKTEIDMPHAGAVFDQRPVLNATALDQTDTAGEPHVASSHPAPVREKTDTELTDTASDVEPRAVPPLPGLPIAVGRQATHEVGGAAAETDETSLSGLRPEASDRHRKEPEAAVIAAQAPMDLQRAATEQGADRPASTTLAEKPRGFAVETTPLNRNAEAPMAASAQEEPAVVAVPAQAPVKPQRTLPATADEGGTATPRSTAVEAGTAERSLRAGTPPAPTQGAKADAPARRQPAETADAPAAPNDDRPRVAASPERAPTSPARPAMQDAAPQRADIRPAGDGTRAAPPATVDVLREERASSAPNGVQTAEPLAGRVIVLPAAVTPAAVPMSPTAAALVTAFAAEASPPQALQQAALAAHTARPGAPVTLQTLKIQLQPAELGLVTARLTADGDRIAVDLQVETSEARHKLAADSDHIVQALRGMGFDIDRVTVQQSQSAGGPGAETRNQAGGFASQGNDGSEAGERRSGGMNRGQDNEAAHDRQGAAAGTGGDAARGGSLYI